MSELARFRKVSISRDRKAVLRSAGWVMKPGENWVLMGNNGSGKTTFLEMIAGYLWPRKGSVEVLGETYGKCYLPDLRKKVGYVAPWVFKRLRDDMPVIEAVASGTEASIGYFGKIPAPLASRARKSLSELGAGELAGKCFGRLSSGEQLKVVLARALINRPAILILDEPFSLLDIGARTRAYRLLEKIARRKDGPALLMATHHLEDIIPAFTHALLLKGGRIIAQGPVRRVLTPGNFFRAFGVRRGARKLF